MNRKFSEKKIFAGLSKLHSTCSEHVYGENKLLENFYVLWARGVGLLAKYFPQVVKTALYVSSGTFLVNKKLNLLTSTWQIPEKSFYILREWFPFANILRRKIKSLKLQFSPYSGLCLLWVYTVCSFRRGAVSRFLISRIYYSGMSFCLPGMWQKSMWDTIEFSILSQSRRWNKSAWLRPFHSMWLLLKFISLIKLIYRKHFHAIIGIFSRQFSPFSCEHWLTKLLQIWHGG